LQIEYLVSYPRRFVRYLEAIRTKVPELVTQEKEQLGCTCEKESVEHIVQGEVSPHGADLDGSSSSPETSAGNGLLDTIRINPITLEVLIFSGI